LTGGISGLIFCGAGSVIPAVSGALGAVTPLEQLAVTTAVHTVAGAVSGGINAAITGSNLGMGMLTGAVGAGIGASGGGALRLLKVDQFGYQLVARTVVGGVAGGAVSEIYGGNFWEGFAQGAATAAVAFLFNHCLHKNGEPDLTCDEYGPDEDVTGEYGLRQWQEQNDRQMEQLAKAGELLDKGIQAGMRSAIAWTVFQGLKVIPGYGPPLALIWRMLWISRHLTGDTPTQR
jgi:hypothetical protein